MNQEKRAPAVERQGRGPGVRPRAPLEKRRQQAAAVRREVVIGQQADAAVAPERAQDGARVLGQRLRAVPETPANAGSSS